MPNSTRKRKRQKKANNAVSRLYRRLQKCADIIGCWEKAAGKFKRICENLFKGLEYLFNIPRIVAPLVITVLPALAWIFTSTSRPEAGSPALEKVIAESDASTRSLSVPSTCLVNCRDTQSRKRLPPFDAKYLSNLASPVVVNCLRLAVSESKVLQSMLYLDSAKGQLGSEARVPLSMVWTTEGSLYLKAGKLEEAINAFRVAIQIFPENPYPYLELGAAIQAWKDTLLYRVPSPNLLDSLKRLIDEKKKCDSANEDPHPQYLDIQPLLEDFFNLNGQSGKTHFDLIHIEAPEQISLSIDTAKSLKTIYLPGDNRILREENDTFAYAWTFSSDTLPGRYSESDSFAIAFEASRLGRYTFALRVSDDGELDSARYFGPEGHAAILPGLNPYSPANGRSIYYDELGVRQERMPVPSSINFEYAPPSIPLVEASTLKDQAKAHKPILQDGSRGTQVVETAKRLGARHTNTVLVYGKDGYGDPDIRDLRFAESDAKDVAERFEKLGFVSSARFGSRLTRRQIFKDLYGEVVRSAPGDTLLLYFSGHGFSDAEGKRYLMVSGSMSDPGIVAVEEIAALLSYHAGEAFVFVDACFDKPNNIKPFSLAVPRFEIEGRMPVIFAASSIGETALETATLGSGISTYLFLEQLDKVRGKDDLDLVRIFSTVKESTSRLAFVRYGHIQSPHVFARKKNSIKPLTSVRILPQTEVKGSRIESNKSYPLR